MAKKVLTTPVGTAVFPTFHAPDTKFDAAGVYKTGLKLSGDEASALKAQIEAGIDAAVEEAKKDPKNKGKKVKRADAPYREDEDTGEIVFNFKMKASGTTREGKPFTQRPAMFDGFGRAIPEGTKVGGGSQIAVAYEMVPFFTALIGGGVTMRLKAVQVVKLQQGQRDAAGFGFGAVEGAEEIQPESPFAAAGEETPMDETVGEGESADHLQSGAAF